MMSGQEETAVAEFFSPLPACLLVWARTERPVRRESRNAGWPRVPPTSRPLTSEKPVRTMAAGLQGNGWRGRGVEA